MTKLPEDQEAKRREMVQLLQSRCSHQRRGVLSQEGHNVLYCQDCLKVFYNEDI